MRSVLNNTTYRKQNTTLRPFYKPEGCLRLVYLLYVPRRNIKGKNGFLALMVGEFSFYLCGFAGGVTTAIAVVKRYYSRKLLLSENQAVGCLLIRIGQFYGAKYLGLCVLSNLLSQ